MDTKHIYSQGLLLCNNGCFSVHVFDGHPGFTYYKHATQFSWYTYFYTCLQKVGKTEMNSTSLLKRDRFSCDETEFCLVSDSFIFRSNTVETEVL